MHDFFWSDEGEILRISPKKNQIVSNHKDYYQEIKEKIGEHPHFDMKNELIDIEYCMKNGGFALYSDVEWFFLQTTHSLESEPKLIKLNLNVPKGLISIEKVHPCIDPLLVVLELVDSNRHLFIVWDIEDNKEKYNYSSLKQLNFATGYNNKAGYLISEDGYIDLDKKNEIYNFRPKYSGPKVPHINLGCSFTSGKNNCYNHYRWTDFC